MADESQLSLLALLDGLIQKQQEEDPEIIGDQALHKVVAHVMLEVAHSPVLPYRGSTEPVEAIPTEGGDYIVRHPGFPRPVSASMLQSMRGRYLLQKGAYLAEWESLPHSEKGRVAAQYFDGCAPGPALLALLKKGRR